MFKIIPILPVVYPAPKEKEAGHTPIILDLPEDTSKVFHRVKIKTFHSKLGDYKESGSILLWQEIPNPVILLDDNGSLKLAVMPHETEILEYGISKAETKDNSPSS